jgi:hypothetical protein
MRKIVIISIVIVISLSSIFAMEPTTSLYSLQVPYSYQTLYLNGSLGGSEALQIEIDTSVPVTFRADLGVSGNYTFVENSEDTKFVLSSAGTYANIGSSRIQFNAAATGEYKSYTLSIGSMNGFYAFGGSANIYLNMPFPGTTTFSTNLRPTAAAGIGRIYSIASVKRITNILEFLDGEITDEKVLDIATYIEESRELLTTYSSDYSKIYISYVKELAKLYGMEGKELELIYADLAQQLDFELERWVGLNYGWEVYAKAAPGLFFETSTTNSFSFDFGLELGASWATLLADEMLYVETSGSITPTLNTSTTPLFYILFNANAKARYFFPSPRMWVDSSLNINYSPLNFTKFDLDIEGQFNYLIHPMFTAFGGARILNTFDKLAIFAGGSMRLF